MLAVGISNFHTAAEFSRPAFPNVNRHPPNLCILIFKISHDSRERVGIEPVGLEDILGNQDED